MASLLKAKARNNSSKIMAEGGGTVCETNLGLATPQTNVHEDTRPAGGALNTDVFMLAENTPRTQIRASAFRSNIR